MKFSKRGSNVKKLKSISSAFLRYFLILSFILVVVTECVCGIIVMNAARATARDRLIRVGRDASTLVENDGAFEKFAEDYREEGINLYVIASDGSVVLPMDSEKWNGNLVKIKKRIRGDKNRSVVFSDNNSLIYAMTVELDGECYLVASYSLGILNGSTSMLVVYFVVVGVVAILVSALVAYSLSQRLSLGIKSLSTTAVNFSKGDFDVNFANAEYQELADLSDTLNSVRDEVKKSGDFQRELLANVSHDLKTPLTMIKAYASMVREISGNDPEKRDKHLQVIIDEADRLTGLVNDVLSVSKVTSNLQEINCKVFNLTEFLYGILNKFEYLQETQGYSFMVDVDPNLYTRADEEKIGQVMYNLLGNAVNYTGDDKTVYISLKHLVAEDRIKLTIRDTGKGISKDELPEIWNRYYRVKENHFRPVKGTGLGLNIVKIILENHSFDFGVESETGKGSAFWVDFPAVSSKDESIK